jgi:plasmid stabilization system protein ParE
MRAIVWTDSALQDLARIDEWYSDRDQAFADDAGDAAVNAARFLTQYPFAGAAFRGELRKWHVAGTQYRLFYSVDDEKVEIVRIRHAREDWRDEP